MAGSNKDVELVIRAKNESSKAVDAIVSSLKSFIAATNDVTKSTNKAGGLVGELGSEISKLVATAKGLSQFEKVAQQIDKAAGAVARLEAEVKASSGEASRLTSEHLKAAEAAKKLEAAQTAAADSMAKQKAAIKEQELAVKQLEKAQRDLASFESRNAKKGVQTSPVSFNANKSANESARVFLSAEVDRAKASADKATASLNALNVAGVATSESLKALKAQAKEAASYEEELSLKVAKAESALKGQKEALSSAAQYLAELKNIASTATNALGGVPAEQQQIAESAKKAAQQIELLTQAQERLIAAQKGLGSAPAARSAAEATAAYRSQQQEVTRLRSEYLAARTSVTQLGAEISRAKQPTGELALQFLIAKTNLSALEKETANAALRLNQLRVGAQGGFSSLAQGAASVQQAARGAASGATATTRLSSALGGLSNNYRQTKGAAASFNDEVKNGIELKRTALSFTQRLRGQLLSLSAAYLGFFQAFNQVGQVISAYRTLEAAQNRLGAAFSGDTASVRRELTFLSDTAKSLGLNFGVLADEYSKFTIAAKASNFTNEATRKIFLSVAEAARVNKLSQDQLSGVMLALQQMISKGTVSSEELRRQLGDRLPGAFNLFAESLGKTTAELDKMMRNGEVLASQSNLLKFAEKLNEKFGPQLSASMRTLTTQLDAFGNNLFVLRTEVATGGFAKALTEGLVKLNQQLSSKAGVQFAKELSAALGSLTKIVFKVFDSFDLLVGVLKLFVAVKLGSYLVGVRASMGGLSTQIAGTRAAILAAATATTALTTGFNAAAVGSTVAMSRIRAQVATLGAALLTARVQAGALGASLVVLRTGLLAVATGIRAVFVALGGWVGVILTILSFGLVEFFSSWATTTDDVTEALNRQAEAVSKVEDAYRAAADGAYDWRKQMEGVTATEIEANTRKLESELNKLRQRMTGAGGTFFFGLGSYELNDPISLQINRLRDQFKAGTLSANDFIKKLDEVQQANPQLDTNIIDPMIRLAREAIPLEEGIQKGIKAVAAMGASSEEAGIKILGMTRNLDGLGNPQKAAALEELNKQFEEIRKTIPGIKDEMQDLADLQAIDDLIKKFSELGLASEKFRPILADLQKAREAINTRSVDRILGGGFADRVISAESGGSVAASNPNSSAVGVGQFIESTWLDLFRKYYPEQAARLNAEAILELRKDQDVSKSLIEAYARENARILQQAGKAATEVNLQLAHFLGPQGALKILNAPGNTPVSQLLSPAAINANPSILGGGATASSVIGYAQQRTGVTSDQITIEQAVTEQLQKQQDAQAEINRSLDETIASKQIELQQTQLSSRDLAIQKAEQDELNRLNKTRNQLTADQLAKLQQIGQLAAQEWDNANRKEQVEASVNSLLARRNELQDQLNTARENGDLGTQERLTAAINATNDELRASIDSAIAFWKANGGPDADNAILKYEGMKAKIRDIGAESIITTQKLNEMLTDGGVNLLDNFAQSLVNSGKAISSLRSAFLGFASDFLRQIAMMIAKQQILNALQAMGGGSGKGGLLTTVLSAVAGSFSGGKAKIAHTGGIIGRTGLSSRMAPSALFANAMRYHTGGFAGLAPNEVPAILQKGEEVLTANDPRHSLNGGGGANVKIVNTIDAGDFVSQGLSTKAGEQSILNFIRANQRAVKSAMGAG